MKACHVLRLGHFVRTLCSKPVYDTQGLANPEDDKHKHHAGVSIQRKSERTNERGRESCCIRMTEGYVIAGSWRNKLSTSNAIRMTQEQIDGPSIVLHVQAHFFHFLLLSFCSKSPLSLTSSPLLFPQNKKTIDTSTMHFGLNSKCPTTAQPSHKSTDSVVSDLRIFRFRIFLAVRLVSLFFIWVLINSRPWKVPEFHFGQRLV